MKTKPKVPLGLILLRRVYYTQWRPLSAEISTSAQIIHLWPGPAATVCFSAALMIMER